ncbi:MAG: hypothetical protein JRI93_08145 [Deltaproteobacteria bacterium]|nr:hypothetical protein [Deltaproteobacteria bacterium]
MKPPRGKPRSIILLGFIIQIAIGIAIEIEKRSNANFLDTDPDSDFDPEEIVLKVTTA